MFNENDKVTVTISESHDPEIRNLSGFLGNNISGVVIGQSGDIVMIDTNKGRINPSIRDVSVLSPAKSIDVWA